MRFHPRACYFKPSPIPVQTPHENHRGVHDASRVQTDMSREVFMAHNFNSNEIAREYISRPEFIEL